MSGGPSGAASRKLAIWVSGDEQVFNQHKAVLAIICALAETFALGVKAGMDPLTLWQAVRQGAVGRRFTFDACW